MAALGLSSRIKAGALLVALIAVLSVGHTVHKLPVPGVHDIATDKASAFDFRLNPVRRDLPSHGKVGYVSDEVPAADTHAALEHFQEFCYTQYAVAPLIVIDSAEYPLVIGNFHKAPSDTISKLKLTLLTDYGNGVMLFKGASR